MVERGLDLIIGVGTDLVEIKRIETALKTDSFKSRCFTLDELHMAKDSPTKLAGNFAVKEAVVKAFGCGFYPVGPSEIEVLRDPSGKPYVTLTGEAKNKAEELGVTSIQVSISNTKDYALAFAVAEGGLA